MDDAQRAELFGACLAKTDLGHEEVRTRGLKLEPLIRRVLILADGQRNLQSLADMMPGQDVASAAMKLLELGCLERRASAPAAPAAEPAAAEKANGLPPAHTRSPQQLDMARNFMINTINTMLEQNSRLTLVKQIFDSRDAAELRQHLAGWEEAMASSWSGKRRLPELRKKLFEVL